MPGNLLNIDDTPNCHLKGDTFSITGPAWILAMVPDPYIFGGAIAQKLVSKPSFLGSMSNFGDVVRKLLFVRAVEDPDGDLPEDQGFRR